MHHGIHAEVRENMWVLVLSFGHMGPGDRMGCQPCQPCRSDRVKLCLSSIVSENSHANAMRQLCHHPSPHCSTDWQQEPRKLKGHGVELFSISLSSKLIDPSSGAGLVPAHGSQAWAQGLSASLWAYISSIDQVACAHPDICQQVCSNPSGCSDIAYPKLVLELLPTGNVLSPLYLVP